MLQLSNQTKLVLIILLAAGLLALRSFQVLTQVHPKIGERTKITGRVSSEPVIFGRSQYFSIDEFKIRTRIFPQVHFGDKLEIVGTLGNDLLISFPEIKKIDQKQDLFFLILKFRKFLISQAAKIWPQPEASLLTGIILGQDTITTEFRKVLITTGTIHIVVVSGQNVAIVAGFVSVLTNFWQRRKVAVLTILAIVFYTLLTGAQPPAVRAAIMGGLSFLAKNLGREYWGFWALAITGFLMLFFNPRLVLDISFQLSFAATFGILAAFPVFEKFFQKFPKLVKESLGITLSAWIFTAPIIAFYFAQFTPITPLSNLFVVPAVPFLMITGAVSILISALNPFLGQIVALVPFIAAAYFTFVVENLSKLPITTLNLAQVNIYLVVGFYIFAILAILWTRRLILAEN